jgi:hypothetical protein
MSYHSHCRGLLQAHPIFQEHMQRTVRRQNPISGRRLTDALLCYNYPVSCHVRLEQLRTLMGRATATWHQHLSKHSHQQFFKISPACDSSTQQLAVRNSNRWPTLAIEEMMTSSCRGGKLPNPGQITCAWRSYAQGAGYSTPNTAQDGQEHRDDGPSAATNVKVEDIPTDLVGWISFVQQLPRTGGLHGKLIVKTLTALADVKDISGRMEEVVDEVSFLVDKARQGTERPAVVLKRVSSAVRKHEALKAAMLQPGSQLLESIHGLMHAAALNAATYANAQHCSGMALAQIRLRLPCESFWEGLCEKGIPSGPVLYASALLGVRTVLAREKLLPPPSFTLWSALLSATCSSLYKQDISKVLAHCITKPLVAITRAESDGWPAAAAASPCKDLQKLTSELLLNQVPHLEKIGLADVRRICAAVTWLEADLTPPALNKILVAVADTAPKMDGREVVDVARFFIQKGCRFSSKVGTTIVSAILRTLPGMNEDLVFHLLMAFGKYRAPLGEDFCAALLTALCRIAPDLEPGRVCSSCVTVAKLLSTSGCTVDGRTVATLSTAILRTAHAMKPVELAGAARAFAKIPLPLDSPAGEVLLARLLEGFEEMNIKCVVQTGWALGRAGVQLPDSVHNALLKALFRVAPSLDSSPFYLFNFLASLLTLERQAIIPEEPRAVLMQAAQNAISQRSSSIIRDKFMQSLIKELGLEVPEELHTYTPRLETSQ